MLSTQDLQNIETVVKKIVRKEVHKEHVETRKTIHEVVGYFDQRVRFTEHRLDHIDTHLGFSKTQNP